MLLQFAHGASPFEASQPVGSEFDGDLVFFPGNGPRAMVRNPSSATESISTFKGCDSWESALDTYSQAIAQCPWLERLCLPLNGVVPTMIDDQWWAIDGSGAALPVKIQQDAGFILLAVSGGHPVDIAAEYDGRAVRPLSVISEGRWVSLAPTITGAV
jgi:hypothetical protein